MASKYIKRIAICIPTYNREKELKRLLKSVIAQEVFPENFIFEMLIIDNNLDSYLDAAINELPDHPFAIHSIHVRQRGLTNVRNAAVSWVIDHDMDALIFVDDDEVVTPVWLDSMVNAWEKYKGDIITGPVVQILPSFVPRFVKKFHLLENDMIADSGMKLCYANSNNTLVSKNVLNTMGPSFHPALNHSGGEDNLFFHQCYLKGFTIIWDNSILIYEPTALERTTTAYVLYRWFHYGMNKIPITKILYPHRWWKQSFKIFFEIFLTVFRGFAASIIKRDNRKFGRSLCWASWLAGNFIKLIGITVTNKTYNQ
jgi:succinoglycan biosynthesis protein ExoM